MPLFPIGSHENDMATENLHHELPNGGTVKVNSARAKLTYRVTSVDYGVISSIFLFGVTGYFHEETQ